MHMPMAVDERGSVAQRLLEGVQLRADLGANGPPIERVRVPSSHRIGWSVFGSPRPRLMRSGRATAARISTPRCT